MAGTDLLIVNPRKRSLRSTKSRKVKPMARRTTTRRKAPARKRTTRRKTATKRRAAPKRKSTSRKRSLAAKKAARTRAANKRRRSVAAKKGAAKRRRTTRRKTTTRRKSPARRRTTRRKSPARRRTTRRKSTKRRTTRRKSPARRRTTRRKSTKRRSTSRRRRVSRRRTTRSRRMSLSGAYKFVMNNMTSFEAFAALGVGLVAGIKLPALATLALGKVGITGVDLTSTWRGPVSGAVLTGLLGYALMSMGVVNSSVANTIALAGVTVGALNLANTYLGLPVPGIALQENGSSGFGFLAGDTLRDSDSIIAFGGLGNMEMEPMSGYHDMGRIVNVF